SAVCESPGTVSFNYTFVQSCARCCNWRRSGCNSKDSCANAIACQHSSKLSRNCASLPGIARERTAINPCGVAQRLHRAWCVVREFDSSDYDFIHAPFRWRWSNSRAAAYGIGIECYCDYRNYFADWNCEEECDFNDRLCVGNRTQRRK